MMENFLTSVNMSKYRVTPEEQQERDIVTLKQHIGKALREYNHSIDNTPYQFATQLANIIYFTFIKPRNNSIDLKNDSINRMEDALVDITNKINNLMEDME